MTPAPPAILEARGLTRVFGAGEAAVTALDRIDLSIPRGELVVLLGPSGCGKSTLLNLVGGLDVPTSGRLICDGVDLSTADEAERTRYRCDRIGFVFQFFNLVPTLTARENVALAASLSEAPRSVDEVLHAVGLAERARHFPGELSGGEQQRVALARALVKNPPILLCDEPTGELDFETGRTVLSLLHRIHHEQGQTVLLVTHNATIGRMADRVVRLRNGRIVEDARVEDPVAPEALEW
jgi:putative ABC transport system ATP-binding protein